jgi:FAD/FMN-containing dehydrogenase
MASGSRIDVFGLAGNGLQHWPAGVAAASHEPWNNWANILQTNLVGHCHPSSEEEVVAIVKTAERTAGARVRAVGSSWSFSDIGMTPGFLVETNEINGVINHVIDRSVLTEFAPGPEVSAARRGRHSGRTAGKLS